MYYCKLFAGVSVIKKQGFKREFHFVSLYIHFVCEFGLRIRLILGGTMNDRHGVCH